MTDNAMNQSQVPDGMVANVPWGTPLDRWSDRMVERGIDHLTTGDEREFFPNLLTGLVAEGLTRGLEV